MQQRPVPTPAAGYVLIRVSSVGVFRYASTWPEAIELVQSRRVDLDSMVTGRFPLERTADALDSDRTAGSVKTVVAVS
jgi:L-iditol 2-dehydrogenase